jgi:tetratricopeptide (TPR) repeat protein
MEESCLLKLLRQIFNHVHYCFELSIVRTELVPKSFTKYRGLCRACFAVILAVISFSASAQTGVVPARRAEQSFLAAKAAFQNERTNPEAAWKFGRACFDWAEFAKDNQQREEIANQGIAACRRVVEQQPKSAEGHYYLGMNLGQLARTKSLGALKLVDEMEKEFQITRGLDKQFDFAGPDRNLGLLYLEAPGWPTSIGNRSKARQHLHQAAQLAPDYPENRLNLLEAYLKWGDKNGAQREFKALTELWPAAKKQFSDEQWKVNWADWDKRWKIAQMKFAEQGKTLQTPRQKK